MERVKFRYNPETLSYDRINTDARYYTKKTLKYLLFGSSLGLIFFFLFSQLFDSPKEKRLRRENNRLITQIEIMNKNVDQLTEVLDDIQLRDENIYRVIYQTDSIPTSIRKAGFGGVNRYAGLENLDNADLVISTAKKIDIAMKQAYIQSKSFDEIIALAKRREEMIKCTPAIMPISNKDLKRTASGWGYRIHPIYKTPKFHYGMDFAAPIGTEIYSTADGKIHKVLRRKTGYGKHVEIDHGFGFHTLYAHMSKIIVKPGQKVKRGDIIGYVGSTGTSTGPHVHYEVKVKNKRVNPSLYYFNDLTAEEYENIIHISSNSNQTFD